MKVLGKLSDGILALLTADEHEQLQASLMKQHYDPIILDIPHRSQIGPDANARHNDCGAACAAMIIAGMSDYSPTVDEIAIKYQKRPNHYMMFGDLLTALRHYGLPCDYQQPLRPDDIRDAIMARRPVIVLVKYPLMPGHITEFIGSHFIVVYGFEGDVFLYRDPLADDDAPLVVEAAALNEAMSGFRREENRPYQGIVMTPRA